MGVFHRFTINYYYKNTGYYNDIFYLVLIIYKYKNITTNRTTTFHYLPRYYNIIYHGIIFLGIELTRDDWCPPRILQKYAFNLLDEGRNVKSTKILLTTSDSAVNTRTSINFQVFTILAARHIIPILLGFRTMMCNLCFSLQFRSFRTNLIPVTIRKCEGTRLNYKFTTRYENSAVINRDYY